MTIVVVPTDDCLLLLPLNDLLLTSLTRWQNPNKVVVHLLLEEVCCVWSKGQDISVVWR